MPPLKAFLQHKTLNISIMHTRRKFIKIGALGMGATALIGATANWVTGAGSNNPSGATRQPGSNIPKGWRRVPTYCEVCFWKCAGWTYVTPEGKIQKITGNIDDPQCNGRLCPRGTGGVGMFTDPDRLKKPLIRVTKMANKPTGKPVGKRRWISSPPK